LVSGDSVPGNIVAVRDLLAEALAVASDAGLRYDYGLALFPRRGRFDAPVFGVVTRGGESTTLTYRMLQSLAEHPVWLSGRVLATVCEGNSLGGSGGAPTGLLDQPVLHLLVTCWAGPDPLDTERTAGLDSMIYAGELKAPVVLLLKQRPGGWPL
jgi:hypothetical protein